MAGKQIELNYNHQSELSSNWSSGMRRFADWFEFADWLKQLNLANKPVLITNWRYV